MIEAADIRESETVATAEAKGHSDQRLVGHPSNYQALPSLKNKCRNRSIPVDTLTISGYRGCVMNNAIATKDQTIAAGLDMMSRATPAQQANHQKVIDWVKTLKNVPSTTNAATTYKECCREWHAVHVLGKPQGTGAYNLDTL